MSRNIILIGFMGSGKTTMGKWIAENAGMKFCDTDDLIEQKEKREIKDIFATEGEAFFRQLETDTIADMVGNIQDGVISVGGGLPVKEENRELLHKLGIVVYLRASKETLVNRLRGDSKRPLLMGENLEDKIEALMSVRSSIYENAADIIVDTDNKKFEQVYNEIEDKILELN